MKIYQKTTYDFTEGSDSPFVVTRHERCLSIHCLEISIQLTKEQVIDLVKQLQKEVQLDK